MRLTTLVTLATSVVLNLFAASDGWAQQRYKISGKMLAENTKYTQQFAIDVGDVPGHQVRIFEMDRTFPKDPPLFLGLKVVKLWIRGFSDYINLNGRAGEYSIFVLENGDKVFARNDSVSQTTVNPDGSKRSTAANVAVITGGTGKFLGIRGTIRFSAVFDPKTGLNENEFEGEYWMEK
jgi:hypothetical protein